MDYTKKTKSELITICKDNGIKGYSSKSKDDLIKLLTETNTKPIKESEVTPQTEVIVTKREKLQDGTTKLKIIDLFAGTGAFTHAFESTNKVECVFANDMVEWSQTIYDLNFPKHKLTLGDLNNIDENEIPSHDILTGGFPCFVAGTKVLTYNGYKNIEDVDLNDTLLTHTGAFQKIVNKQIKLCVSDLNEIKIMYHPHSIKATDEHPFYVKERVKKWDNNQRTYKYEFSEAKWITAKDLENNHYVGMPINHKSQLPSFNIDINNLDEWFLMGYFVGDGWIEETIKKNGQSSNKIRFTIADKDIDYVLPKLRSVLPITSKQCRTGACEKYECSNVNWFNILKQFGKYAHNKIIPEWIQDAPIEYIKSFLDGYSKANGGIYPSSKGIQNHHISYTTTSYNLAFGIQRLYLKLGLLCSVDFTERKDKHIIEGRVVNQRSTYRMRVVLDRNHSPSILIEQNYAWLKIKSNNKNQVDEQVVYNFEVENDNTYCVENSIVHNCQPFSIAGKQEGFNDERSNVFWKILKIIDKHTPNYIVLENVKNLISHDKGKTFKTIKENLENRGYNIKYKVLNTSSITGIPQHRERIYIVGIKDKKIFDKFSLDFPEVNKQPVSNMFENNIPEKYYYTDKSSTWDLVTKNITKKDTIYQYRRVYVRENKSNECPTLTANMGGGGHNVPLILDNKGIRKLTPRECFNFQGFPKTYKLPNISDTNLYKLAGNAVSVPVVKLIVERLIPLLNVN
jgi:DNA (cytosine-5)-methyltransferase 1